MYGVPYMETQVDPSYQVTLRGFSPRELNDRAERACASHFGASPFEVSERRCVPCVCTLGGRVRLYEAHVVACATASSADRA